MCGLYLLVLSHSLYETCRAFLPPADAKGPAMRANGIHEVPRLELTRRWLLGAGRVSRAAIMLPFAQFPRVVISSESSDHRRPAGSPVRRALGDRADNRAAATHVDIDLYGHPEFGRRGDGPAGAAQTGLDIDRDDGRHAQWPLVARDDHQSPRGHDWHASGWRRQTARGRQRLIQCALARHGVDPRAPARQRGPRRSGTRPIRSTPPDAMSGRDSPASSWFAARSSRVRAIRAGPCAPKRGTTCI
jgi:hypothetical protein